MQNDSNGPRDLDAVRKEIDAIDHDIVHLVNRRTELAQEIGHLKGRSGKPFFTPERERTVLESLRALNPGPLNSTQITSIFREIISAARAAEQPLRIAFWGPEGTFSFLAAREVFGASCDYVPQDSIRAVFESVENGHAHYGVVPIENSVAGVVPETLDMFPQTNVKICAESYLSVQHHLGSLAPSLDQVERLYVGPQPRHQCRQWIQLNLPHAEIVEVVPTAVSGERALKDPNSAAIISHYAAEVIGLPLLAERIEDDPKNRTRFLTIGFNEPLRTGRDKTSLIFNLRNRPGELYRALGILDREGVNLSMIESRPAANVSFEYMFFCDCAGHRSDEPVAKAIAALQEYALEAIWIGSYPAAQ